MSFCSKNLYCFSVSGGVSPSAKSQRRRAMRGEAPENEDPAARAARRAAWRAARLRSLEQVKRVFPSLKCCFGCFLHWNPAYLTVEQSFF